MYHQAAVIGGSGSHASCALHNVCVVLCRKAGAPVCVQWCCLWGLWCVLLFCNRCRCARTFQANTGHCDQHCQHTRQQVHARPARCATSQHRHAVSTASAIIRYKAAVNCCSKAGSGCARAQGCAPHSIIRQHATCRRNTSLDGAADHRMQRAAQGLLRDVGRCSRVAKGGVAIVGRGAGCGNQGCQAVASRPGVWRVMGLDEDHRCWC